MQLQRVAWLLPVFFGLVPADVVPKIRWISEDKKVAAGGSVELVCSVTYNPQALVMWYKVDDVDDISLKYADAIYKSKRFNLTSKLDDSGSKVIYVLKITNIQEDDCGKYRCHVQFLSGFGDIHFQSKHVNVHFQYPPTVHGLFGLGSYSKGVVVILSVVVAVLFASMVMLILRIAMFIYSTISQFVSSVKK